MALVINPVENHRERESGILAYPVYSRRAGGLSIGINLFPDKKNCPFDCAYCEVFPFSTNAVFSLEKLETSLLSVIENAHDHEIRDICFSGNGEPTLSPAFPEALKLAAVIREKYTANASLVLITNGAGLLQTQIFSLLKEAALNIPSFDIWLKLDAGTKDWYQKINRTAIPFEKLISKIKDFIFCAPVTIQTMLCKVDGNMPPDNEAAAWESLLIELTASNIRKVQLYGKARPAPEDPKSSPVPVEYLEQRAASLRMLFANMGIQIPVEIYP